MKGLHQQLAEKRAELKANEVKARSTKADPRDASDAAERIPFLKGQQIPALETDIELAEAAAHQAGNALTNLRTVKNGGRELALAITELETALWRLRNHLGTKPAPCKPAKAGTSRS